ncbi:hybrid sensor histidine kinase/response regulator [Mastigocladopsis repens]|uniref:hybrid sensor histidine kinase/response regulator n=1 Tax=Mastigocladopsis repens TaxID=221287 RepID=UPI000684CB5B|nr:ATP-binding protein [Mastigocladopsis repens]
MKNRKIHILLVEDSAYDACLLCQIFTRNGYEEWQMAHVEQLNEAIDACISTSSLLLEKSSSQTSQTRYQRRFDVVLLDLSLPDSFGLDTVKEFRKAVPNIPVVVLSRLDNEELALQALAEGAQDYIVKDQITIQVLVRAIRYAIQRGQIFNQLWASEQRTREALAKEQELNQLKSNFVAMVSHEFRTPISIIRTSTELLANYNPQLTEERRAKYFQRIQVSINQMVQLLDEVLFLSKTEAEKVAYQPALLDLKNFCQELAEILQLNLGGQRNIVFSCQGECTPAKMDEKLLSCIFTNILSNAIKYSFPDSTIYFDLSCQDGIATFRVQDQGLGIPLKDQARLFESFYRARNVGKIQGTGLGLVIVKKCVALHRGEIQIESEEGVGTTVTVRLPIHPPTKKHLSQLNRQNHGKHAPFS